MEYEKMALKDSINNCFDQRSNHSYQSIGKTLDDLCEGRCRISDIPRITVVNEAGQWISADNRRLWVFRHLERLGKCDTIPVIKGYSIPPAKRTSYNGGKSITVRRNPGGRWYKERSYFPPSASSCSSSSDIRYGLPRSGLDASRIRPSLSLQPMEFKYRPWETSCNTDTVDEEDPSKQHRLVLPSRRYGYNPTVQSPSRIDSVTNTDMTSRGTILQLPLESEQCEGGVSDLTGQVRATPYRHDERLSANTGRSTPVKHRHEPDVDSLAVTFDGVDIRSIEGTEENMTSYVNMTEQGHHDTCAVVLQDEGFSSRKRGWLCCNIL